MVVVNGTSADTQALRYSASLGGTPLRAVDTVQPSVSQQLYALADGQSGSFAVDVRALGSDGCALAVGHSEILVDGSAAARLTVSVTLIAQSPSLCTITVSSTGGGSVSSDPAGLSCGSNCSLEVAAGSTLSLSASPPPRVNFVGWSGACSGSGPCSLKVLGPLSVAASFSPALCNGSVCWESPLPADLNLNGLWGAAAADLWAVADGGQLLHYDGTSWAISPSPTASNLRALWGSGPSDIWAVGVAGTFLHYDGSAWSLVAAPGGSTATLNAVSGSASSDIWAVGAGGIAFHYDGSAWSPAPTGILLDLNGVVASPTQVLAVAANGQLFRRSGATFTAAGANPSQLWGVSGPSDNNILMVGDGGTIQGWDGNVLTKQPSYPGITSLRAVQLRSFSDGWAVGSEGAVLHYSGTSFARLPAPTNQTLQAVFAFSTSDVWAVGSRGTILHYDGSSLSAYGTTSFPDSADLRAVSSLGVSEQWAVGTNNTILHNSGQGWVAVPSGQSPNTSFRGVYAASPNEVWVVGNNLANGYAVVLRNSGSGFGAVAAPLTTQQLTSISGSGPNNIWIGGSAGTMLRWNGSSFSSVSASGFVPQILSVAAVSPSEVWFGCSPVTITIPSVQTVGCILRWDGSAITLIKLPQLLTLNGASAAMSSDVWLTGTNPAGRGVAVHVLAGVVSSVVDLSVQAGELDGVVARTPSDVWLSGVAGVLLHSSDGTTFTRVGNGLSAANLYGIIGAGPSALVTVGSARAILRILQ